MNISFLVGKKENIEKSKYIISLRPFDDDIVNFLNDLSKEIVNDAKAKSYPDVVTFAFYIRKSNIMSIKQKLYIEDDIVIKQGVGVAFHVAPSNVAVNFAYSLISSLLCGNANYVKVSSKQFEQVDIICNAINKTLANYKKLEEYINIIRYNNEKVITDLLSSICDIRIIWGGNATIDAIRQSRLVERAREITFADRYSLAVIDIDYYNSMQEKEKDSIINGFYNDTFLSDQNACTSPRLICFLGKSDIDDFYSKLHEVVLKKYVFNDIYASNKYVFVTSFATTYPILNPKLLRVKDDNLVYRVLLDNNVIIPDSIINYKGNCGIFLEVHYDNANGLNNLNELCNNTAIQTISYVGDKHIFDCLKNIGFKGIDRIVKVGTTMDFDMIWDGYNLFEMLTRNIMIK